MISIFSRADNRFLPDRYITGTCPHCGYDQARGDQCENCTRVLDPADLINPRSAISGSPDIENPRFEVSVFETDRVRRKAAELDRGQASGMAKPGHVDCIEMVGLALRAISVLATVPRTMRCEVRSMRYAKAAKR